MPEAFHFPLFTFRFLKQKWVEEKGYTSNQALKAFAGKPCQQETGIFRQDSYEGSAIWRSDNPVMDPGSYRFKLFFHRRETGDGNEQMANR